MDLRCSFETVSNQFTANTPLSEGENTVTVTATDIDGNTTSVSLVVTMQPMDDYIRISADPTSGVSPLEITLNIEGSFDFTSSAVSYAGPDEVEFLETGADQYRVRMTTEGIYTFTAEVIDDQGYTHMDTVAVQVLDEAVLNALLTAKWEGMKMALISGDVDGALGYHHEDAQERYAAIYNALGSDLPMLAQQMQAISHIYFEGSRAKYRIRQDHDVEGQTVTITYYIYFSQDENGIWRIEKY